MAPDEGPSAPFRFVYMAGVGYLLYTYADQRISILVQITVTVIANPLQCQDIQLQARGWDWTIKTKVMAAPHLFIPALV